MNALRGLLISVLGAACAASAQARLGDTLNETVHLYGDATERVAVPPADQSLGFTREGVEIEADFIAGVVHRVTYRLHPGFTDEQIQIILSENAGTYSWAAQSNRLNPMRDAIGQRVWLRSDRGSATLTRHTDGEKTSENLVLTDGVWLMANLKLKLAPTPIAVPATSSSTTLATVEAPATPATTAVPAATKSHTLTWNHYDGVSNPTAAHLVLDDQDLGSGDAGLAALKQHLAALPAKSEVKVMRYYGDPGGGVRKTPPLDLAELHAYCAAHDLSLLVPMTQ